MAFCPQILFKTPEEDTLHEKSKITCILCKDILKNPILLNCLHYFCKQCLKDYFMCEITSTGKDNSLFICCPICNFETTYKENFIYDDDFLATIPESQILLTLIDQEDMMKSIFHCVPCKNKGKVSISQSWCFQCRVNLCSECLSFHSAMPTLTNHTVLNIEELSSNLLEISFARELCESHNTCILMYCKDHMHGCCNTCIALDHRHCSLMEIASMYNKTSFQNLKASISDINTHLNEMREKNESAQEEVDEFQRGGIDQIEKKFDVWTKNFLFKSDILTTEAHKSAYYELQNIEMKRSSLENKSCVLGNCKEILNASRSGSAVRFFLEKSKVTKIFVEIMTFCQSENSQVTSSGSIILWDEHCTQMKCFKAFGAILRNQSDNILATKFENNHGPSKNAFEYDQQQATTFQVGSTASTSDQNGNDAQVNDGNQEAAKKKGERGSISTTSNQNGKDTQVNENASSNYKIDFGSTLDLLHFDDDPSGDSGSTWDSSVLPPAASLPFNGLNLNHKLTVDIEDKDNQSHITSCAWLALNEIIVVDRKTRGRSSARIYDIPSGVLLRTVHIRGKPYDILPQLSEKTVAITIPEAKKISIHSFENSKYIKSINTEITCYGISKTHDDLLVIAGEEEIHFIGMDGEVKKRLSVPGEDVRYVYAVSSTLLFYTSLKEGRLYSVTGHGRNRFCCEPENMKGAAGIVVDRKHYTYVCEKGSKYIHKINVDGKVIEKLCVGDTPSAIAEYCNKICIVRGGRKSANKAEIYSV